jgi:hypothetical protein
MNLPGYDAWKLANPYDQTAKQEREAERDRRDNIEGTIDAYTSDLNGVLADLIASLRGCGAELASVTVDVGVGTVKVEVKP